MRQTRDSSMISLSSMILASSAVIMWSRIASILSDSCVRNLAKRALTIRVSLQRVVVKKTQHVGVSIKSTARVRCWVLDAPYFEEHEYRKEQSGECSECFFLCKDPNKSC